ncbi:hypothetical protein ACQQ2N_12955 [Dokdonella sp. MW10]|uniref:hypothetical protein n=1 Tax=Dokdonella sp. MW10 TaxID=2992926 RepID=UPI003F7FA79A
MDRLIPIRLVVALVLTLGILVATAGSAIASPAVDEDAIPVLPAVVVSATIAPDELPVVVVVPSAQEIADALAGAQAQQALAHGGEPSLVEEMLPRARLDMPYYSFGRMMPRTTKD